MNEWMKKFTSVFYLSIITTISFAQQSELKNHLIDAVNKGDLIRTQAYIAAIESLRLSGSLHTQLRLWLAGGPLNVCDDTGKPLLICAIRQQKTDIIMYLLKAGADVHKRTLGTWWTPLMYAVAQAPVEIVTALLDNGARVNDDANGRTPLAIAARRNHYVLVALLLKRGALPNVYCRRLKFEASPLHYAAHQANLRIMSLLVRSRANINKLNEALQTPLLLAVKSGNPAATDLLIRCGAQLHIQDCVGDTPLIIACREGYRAIVKQLCNHESPPTKQERNSGRELALKHGHYDIADILFALDKQPLYQQVPSTDSASHTCQAVELTQPLLDL